MPALDFALIARFVAREDQDVALREFAARRQVVMLEVQAENFE